MTPGRPSRTVELRVHGVGGSHGAKMLGYESETDVVVVGEGVGGTRVLARRRDPSVESYEWGDLTSGSGVRALWILLLPFTLINVAGWMHPPVDRTSVRRVKLIRGIVHGLSVMLTLIYVITLGVIVVDLIGWQWSRRVAWKADGLESTLGAQKQATKWAMLVLFLGLLGLMRIGQRSQVRFEESHAESEPPRSRAHEARWGDDDRLRNRNFFFHPGAAKRILRWHGGVVLLGFAIVVGLAVRRGWQDSGSSEKSLRIFQALIPFTIVVIIGLIVLFMFSWRTSNVDEERWVRCGPAIAATLAFIVLTAASAGVHLLLIKRLNDWPNRPKEAPQLLAGSEVNVVDLWGLVIISLAVMVAVVLMVRGVEVRRATRHLRPTRTTPPGRALDGVEKDQLKAVARSQFIVDLVGRSGRLGLAFAAVLLAAYVYVVCLRLRLWELRTLILPPPSNPDGRLFQIGAYVLPLLILVLGQVVRKGYGGAKTFASTVWDVLTFWPRRFSPLGVRPYSERAVPELRGRIEHHVGEGRPLVLSAHSQGSILGFAALDALPNECLERVAFVSYGSPITSIFGAFFPAYFGTDEVHHLQTRLPSLGGRRRRWTNFYRSTDPIGGRVFPGQDIADVELPDPIPVRTGGSDRLTPPLERDLEPWILLAKHSHYLREPSLKRWVAAVREELAADAR